MSRNGESTRSKLLDTAFRLFYQHGYQGTGLDRILQQAGFSKGALYNHFSNKQELGYAVIEEVISPWILDFWRTRFQENSDPIDALAAVLSRLITEPPRDFYTLGCPLNNLIQETADVDDGCRVRLAAIVDRWIDMIAENLRRGQAEGKVRTDINARNTAVYLAASLEGAIGLTKVRQNPTILITVSERLLDEVMKMRPPG